MIEEEVSDVNRQWADRRPRRSVIAASPPPCSVAARRAPARRPTRRRRSPRRRAPAAAAPSAAAGDLNVVFIPKAINNPYFDAAATGAQKAATELGGQFKQIGPTDIDDRGPDPVHPGRDDPGLQGHRRLGDRRRRGRAGAQGRDGGRHQGRRLRLQPGRGRLRRLRQPDRLQPHRRRRWPSGPATSPRTAPARSRSCRRPRRPRTRTPGSRT